MSLRNIPPHIYHRMMTNTWTSIPLPASVGAEDYPDDAEYMDVQFIRVEIDKLMDAQYPPFEPEIIYAMDKEYFLPALKVLIFDGQYFYSPQRKHLWRDNELYAHCLADSNHNAPDENCECGVYGSVNMEEIYSYFHERYDNPAAYLSSTIYSFPSSNESEFIYYRRHEEPPRPVLCIVEPAPDAKYILCRKGWKASHAFISEVIATTISVNDASQLLSIAWRRNLDLRRLFDENRQNY